MEIGIWEREHAKGHIIQDNFLDKYFFFAPRYQCRPLNADIQFWVCYDKKF